MKNYLRLGSDQIFLAVMIGMLAGLVGVAVQHSGRMAHPHNTHTGIGQWLYRHYSDELDQAHSLLNVEWVVTRIGTDDVHLAANDRPITLKLERETGRILSYDGCGMVSGSYKTNGKKYLKLDCSSDGANACDRQAQRDAFLTALKRVDTFMQQGDMLILMEGKDPLITLTPAYLAEPMVKQVSN